MNGEAKRAYLPWTLSRSSPLLEGWEASTERGLLCNFQCLSFELGRGKNQRLMCLEHLQMDGVRLFCL